jgi:hypothetical protein
MLGLLSFAFFWNLLFSEEEDLVIPLTENNYDEVVSKGNVFVR